MREKWTTTDIPDLSGKVIIVTGGNSGTGYESVKEFARKGAEVILACRNNEKGTHARKEILALYPQAKVIIMQLDLMDLASVRDFSDTFRSRYSKLDVLLNNAGIMMVPYGLTKDGFESQMGTNHLGHFALTGLLLDLIIKTPNSRVVNISSNAHKFKKMDFNNFLFENGKDYGSMKSYSRSKLANLLFTYELHRRFEIAGSDSMSVAAHPGIAETNLGKHLEGKFLFKLLSPIFKLMVQDAAMGALPGIRASVDPNVKSSEYYGPDGARGSKGFPIVVESNKASYDEEDAKRLWEVSEKLTGIQFEF